MSVISDEVKKSNESPFMANLSRLIIFHKNDLIRNAINLFMLKKYEEAQDYLLNSYPEYSLSEDTNALLLMGHIQIKLSQLDSALEYFRQGLKMSKRDDFFIYDSLGMIYFFKKEYDMSLKYINEAFSFSENNYYYQYHSGLYYEAILKNRLEGKISFDDIQQLEIKDIKDKIKEYYSRAIEIDPNAYNPLINIGTLYASDKDFNQAEKFFKKAILINETDWRINLNMAFIYIKDKSYGIALEFLEKVVKTLGDTKDLNILIPYIICLYKERSWEKLEKY
jgi:tetratricopeptide (TPR) repeat protein